MPSPMTQEDPARTRVTVIIRAYNEALSIGRLLDGVMQQTLKDVEIILVDSGSTDATVSIAESYGARVLSIRPEDFSFGHSLNVGCHAATGDICVIASAHVYPTHRDWLELLVAPFEDPRVALVYGRQRGAPTTRYSEHRIFRQWFPDASHPDQPQPFCNNANAAIRRQAWLDQPYDETLTGLEDLDWAQRAMQRGGRIVYEARANVIHVHHETPDRVFNRYRREAMALRRVFPDSHFGIGDFARLLTANILSDWVHAAAEGVLHRKGIEIVWFRWMQFAGTLQGYRHAGAVTASLRQRFYYPASLRRQGTGEHVDRLGLEIDYGADHRAPDHIEGKDRQDADRRARAHASP